MEGSVLGFGREDELRLIWINYVLLRGKIFGELKIILYLCREFSNLNAKA